MKASHIRPDILRGWQIVVVDDEEDSLEVAEIILSAHSAEVHIARNGIEGIDTIRRVRPRLIISDISMPQMDGWGLIHALKSDRALMDIPVIALTAHAMRGDRDFGIAAGFHNYLTKPLTVDTFVSELLILLEGIPSLAGLLDQAKTPIQGA